MHAVPELTPEGVEHAAQLVGQADALVIAAGAGIGVDSGLPDFRSNDGFWNAYPALARSAINFTEVASPRTFRTDPTLAWGFYGHRLALYRATVPHEGFWILRRWAEQLPMGAFVFTSNVDGQFQKAGFAADDILEHHGSIHWLQCLDACSEMVWPADEVEPDVDADACRWRGPMPTCPFCGRLARPAILMFGDGQWIGRHFDVNASRLDYWLSKVHRPVVVEIGAGTAIPSVRHFSEKVICDHGGRLVRINPREAQVPSPWDIGLAIGSLDGLRAIDRVVEFS
jgi:NAD-dependent SIR2 family protein deacetylase